MALTLPATPADFLRYAVIPALQLLPPRMDSKEARVMLIAIALQESALEHRWQVIDRNRPNVKGPARGLLQFERGTRASRGGVWGVYLHPASRHHLETLCDARGCKFDPDSIYHAIETDDVLAAGLGRLLLWTDPKSLPGIGQEEQAWDLYLRTWRPGKPHKLRWPANYMKAVSAVR